MLSKSSVIILGFLHEGDKNPYEIVRLYKELGMSRWFKIAESTIYAAVSKLEEKGFIKGKTVEQDALPQKTIYSITPEGETELKRAVLYYLDEWGSETSKFEIGILLIDTLSKDEILKKLKKKLGELDKTFYEVKRHILNLERSSPPVPFSTMAVFKHKYHTLDAERKTINDLIRVLNTRRGRKPNRTAFDLRIYE